MSTGLQDDTVTELQDRNSLKENYKRKPNTRKDTKQELLEEFEANCSYNSVVETLSKAKLPS